MVVACRGGEGRGGKATTYANTEISLKPRKHLTGMTLILGTYVHTDAYVCTYVHNNAMDSSSKGLLAINLGSHTTHIRMYICTYGHMDICTCEWVSSED